MKIGAELRLGGDVGELFADARALEAAGADSLWVIARDDQDPWILAAALAPTTWRARLVVVGAVERAAVVLLPVSGAPMPFWFPTPKVPKSAGRSATFPQAAPTGRPSVRSAKRRGSPESCCRTTHGSSTWCAIPTSRTIARISGSRSASRRRRPIRRATESAASKGAQITPGPPRHPWRGSPRRRWDPFRR